MNGIEKITNRLMEDAKEEVSAIEAEASAQCTEILARYNKEAEDLYWKMATAGKQAADQRRERMEGAASLEAKKQVLLFKQGQIEKTFEEAAQHIVDLPEEQYVTLLASLVCQAASTGEEKLIFSAKDRGRVGKAVTLAANEGLSKKGLAANLSMSEETRDILGGVVVTNGQVDLNCSVEALVAAVKTELAGDVSKVLFDQQ